MKAVAQTDQGRVRTTNQDTVYCSVKPVGKLPNLFVVADGMGGQKAGDYASSSAINDLVEIIKSNKKDKLPIEIIRNAIEKTNSRIYQESKENPDFAGMGTTLVTAVVEGDSLYVSNVGDSRLYIVNEGIAQITRDHSYVEEMARSGRLKRGSEEYRSKKNILMRAIGSAEKVNADFFELKLNQGDVVLLCSDGLSNMLEDDTILSIIHNAESVSAAAKQLIAAANENGGSDNVSVVIISDLPGGAA